MSEAGPGELIFYPADEVHGTHKPGDEPGHYLVFEWHGAPMPLGQTKAAAAAPALTTV